MWPHNIVAVKRKRSVQSCCCLSFLFRSTEQRARLEHERNSCGRTKIRESFLPTRLYVFLSRLFVFLSGCRHATSALNIRIDDVASAPLLLLRLFLLGFAQQTDSLLFLLLLLLQLPPGKERGPTSLTFGLRWIPVLCPEKQTRIGRGKESDIRRSFYLTRSSLFDIFGLFHYSPPLYGDSLQCRANGKERQASCRGGAKQRAECEFF